MTFISLPSLVRVRRAQFGLRGLLLFITILAIWLGLYLRTAREQQSAVKVILAQGGKVSYDAEINDDAPHSWRHWLAEHLCEEENFFSRVVEVDLFFATRKAGIAEPARNGDQLTGPSPA